MLKKCFLIGAIALSLQVPINNSSFALGYREMSVEDGTKKAINIKIWPGRITTIDFSKTEEKITYVGLGDSSRIVWNSDRPIRSSNAQTIFLRSIEAIDFPGATKTPVTNLVVKTVDSKGNYGLYNFQLIHSSGGVSELGVIFVPSIQLPISISLANGKSASLDDIEIGLEFAIAQGFTDDDDRVVSSVRSFLAIARNSPDISLQKAIETSSVDLNILTSLAQIAFDNYRVREINHSDVDETVSGDGKNSFLDRLKLP